MIEICIINYGSNAAEYGIGTYIKEYVHCLLNIGCNVNLVELGVNSKLSEVSIKEEKGVRTFCFPYVPSENFAVYNKSVCRLLRLYLKDSSELIFHFHYQQSNSLLEKIKQYFPLSKSVLTVHYLYWSARFNGDLTEYKKVLRCKNYKHIKKNYQDVVTSYEQEKQLIQSVDQVVCLSEDTYNLLKELYGINTGKLTIIPNGLIPRQTSISIRKRCEIRKRFHLGLEERIILFVGRINPIKGIYPLLVAFSKIIEVDPLCRLVLIGDGDFAGVMKRVPYIVSKVTFTGRLDKKVLYQWYQIADLGVFPSYYEECSYVGIEMLMHGLPIVASDGYAVRNMFDERNAVIAPIGEYNKPEVFVSGLSRALLTLLHSEQLLILKSRQALQSYKEVYHSLHMQQKYSILFNKLYKQSIL